MALWKKSLLPALRRFRTDTFCGMTTLEGIYILSVLDMSNISVVLVGLNSATLEGSTLLELPMLRCDCTVAWRNVMSWIKRLTSVGNCEYIVACVLLLLCVGCCGIQETRAKSLSICVRVDIDSDKYALIPIRQRTNSSFIDYYYEFVERCDAADCEYEPPYNPDYYLVGTECESVVSVGILDVGWAALQRISFDKITPTHYGWLVCGDYSDEPKWIFKDIVIARGICEILWESAKEPLRSILNSTLEVGSDLNSALETGATDLLQIETQTK